MELDLHSRALLRRRLEFIGDHNFSRRPRSQLLRADRPLARHRLLWANAAGCGAISPMFHRIQPIAKVDNSVANSAVVQRLRPAISTNARRTRAILFRNRPLFGELGQFYGDAEPVLGDLGQFCREFAMLSATSVNSSAISTSARRTWPILSRIRPFSAQWSKFGGI